MSQPRDRRVFSSSAAVAEARSGLVSERSSTPPPQVTLEPLTSFKRSLEEIGFDTGPGDEPQLLQGLSQSSSTGFSSSSEAPINTRSRESLNSPVDSEIIEIPDTILTGSQPSSASMSSSYATRLVTDDRRQPTMATPPLLPPIAVSTTSGQSHLLELISGFSNGQNHRLLHQPVDERADSPATTNNDGTSASETEVVLSRRATAVPSMNPGAEPLRTHLNQLRHRLATASASRPSQVQNSAVSRRLFRNPSGANSRSVDHSHSQHRHSLESNVSSNRSPELPPIHIPDNGLGVLTSLLYNETATPATTTTQTPSTTGGNAHAASLGNGTFPSLGSRSRPFIPNRPFVESPSPPITGIDRNANTNVTVSSALGNGRDQAAIESARRRDFEEAIERLRPTPPLPPHNLTISTNPRYPPFLPHPFQEPESASPSLVGGDDSRNGPWDDSWNMQEELRYIHNLETVIDEREWQEREMERTPVRNVPTLPPILPSPLLVVDGGMDFDSGPLSQSDVTHMPRTAEEETEWEADEVPSAWLREHRRHLGRSLHHASSSSSLLAAEAGMNTSAPMLELPNFSSTSLGLVDFSLANSSSPVRTQPAPLDRRISTEQLRQLPTEHLRQLRRVAMRSVASRSRSRSSIAASIMSRSSQGDEPATRPESVVSGEDIVVGVPMLDEPFDRSVWRALEGRISHEHQLHPHHPHEPSSYLLREELDRQFDRPRSLPTLDIRRQPRISLGPMSSGLDIDGSLLSSRADAQNDRSDNSPNVSIRPAVPSVGGREDQSTQSSSDPGSGAWRAELHDLVEGSLSSSTLPALALTPPAAGSNDRSNWQRFPRNRPTLTRSASTNDGSSLSVNILRDNSSTVAVTDIDDNRSFRAPRMSSINNGISPHIAELVSITSPVPTRDATPSNQTAYRLLDSWYSNATPREMETFERFIQERRIESPRTHRRSFSPLWDTDDPFSDFLSDVGFDGSYEALLELAEQLGTVPRGLSDSAFATLKTMLFKELASELMLSPALSTVSFVTASDNILSPTFASPPGLASPPPNPNHHLSHRPTRVRRAGSGKWAAQCSICLEQFLADDLCVSLDCSHFFHKICVREWFNSASTCPLCRHPVPRS